VGRSTFFRYFPDKQHVMFEDDAASHLLLAKAIAGAARPLAPLGGSLASALRALRAGDLVLADSKAIQAVRYPIREQLIASHPQLQACSLAKEREYTDAAQNALIEQGADPMTARLAAHIATACYDLAYTETFDTPLLLPQAVDKAFQRLSELKDW
jgi:AcrR family transcriptional regulator